ncbi:MAG: hypothetical protein FJX76_26260, partial [Armatimonadetes bacterium]|nr:hypothetical protein [Armatimonadota bacterium]
MRSYLDVFTSPDFAAALVEAGLPEDAVCVARAASDTADGKTLATLAVTAHQANDPDAARALLRRAESLLSDWQAAFLTRPIAMIGEESDVLWLADKAAEWNHHGLLCSAERALELGRVELARSAAHILGERRRDNPPDELPRLLASLGEVERAEQFAHDPNGAKAVIRLSALAQGYLTAGRHKYARRALRKAFRAFQRVPESEVAGVANVLCSALSRLGHHRRAAALACKTYSEVEWSPLAEIAVRCLEAGDWATYDLCMERVGFSSAVGLEPIVQALCKSGRADGEVIARIAAQEYPAYVLLEHCRHIADEDVAVGAYSEVAWCMARNGKWADALQTIGRPLGMDSFRYLQDYALLPMAVHFSRHNDFSTAECAAQAVEDRSLRSYAAGCLRSFRGNGRQVDRAQNALMARLQSRDGKQPQTAARVIYGGTHGSGYERESINSAARLLDEAIVAFDSGDRVVSKERAQTMSTVLGNGPVDGAWVEFRLLNAGMVLVLGMRGTALNVLEETLVSASAESGLSWQIAGIARWMIAAGEVDRALEIMAVIPPFADEWCRIVLPLTVAGRTEDALAHALALRNSSC